MLTHASDKGVTPQVNFETMDTHSGDASCAVSKTNPAIQAPALEDTAFGVYIHWPFCLAKCPYCDFNSHVRDKPIDETRFVSAFVQEIAHRAALTPGRIVTSVFFGGGTPSLMQPSSVESILKAIGTHWSLSDNAEISLEANPTSVEAERFRGFRAAGINRVSLGIQSLHDADLKALGRRHSVSEALRALDIAQSNFERVSFDLIYARMAQTPEDWAKELALLLLAQTTYRSTSSRLNQIQCLKSSIMLAGLSCLMQI